MRQWPNDPTIAHLVLVDHTDVPTADDIVAAVEHARRRGARAIRTSALFPRSTDVVLAAGFEVIDRLSLLSVELTPRPVGGARPAAPTRTSTLRAWHLRESAEVDRDAFGPLWGNDARTLLDITRATPRHRARQIRDGGTMVGFAISGAAGDQGYLQRIAVRSDRRRQGHAQSLVVDALDWMRANQLGRALVNTGSTNTAALALYEQFGFRRLDDVLTVAELRLVPLEPGAVVVRSRSAVSTPPGSTT